LPLSIGTILIPLEKAAEVAKTTTTPRKGIELVAKAEAPKKAKAAAAKPRKTATKKENVVAISQPKVVSREMIEQLAYQFLKVSYIIERRSLADLDIHSVGIVVKSAAVRADVEIPARGLVLVQLDLTGAAHVHKVLQLPSRKDQLKRSLIRLADGDGPRTNRAMVSIHR
jgi:hypothetical protein